MPTIEQLAANFPVGGDISRGLDVAQQRALAGAEEYLQRRRMQQALASQLVRNLMAQATASPGAAQAPGLFQSDLPGVAQAIPGMAEAVGLPSITPPGAMISSGVPPAPQPSGPRIGAPEMPQMGLMAGLESPEQMEIASKLMPAINQRYLSEERLTGQLAGAEQRHAKMTTDAVMRGVSIAQQNAAMLQRMQMEQAKLAAKPKQTRSDLSEQLRLAQIMATLAGQAAQQVSALSLGGMDAAMPGSPTHAVYQESLRFLGERRAEALEKIEQLQGLLGGRAEARSPGPKSEQKAPGSADPVARLIELAAQRGRTLSREEAQGILARRNQ